MKIGRLLFAAVAIALAAAGAYAQNIGGTSSFTGGNGGSTKVTVISPPNDVVSGPTNLTSTGTVVVNAQGSGSVGIIATGTGSGLTFGFQGSVDGTNYVTIPCVVPSTGAIVNGGSANGTWTCQSAGYQDVRVNLTAISGGTETFTLNASAGSSQPPIGTQGTSTNITAVGGNAVTTTVPVSGTVSANPAPATTGGLSVYNVQPTASDNHAVIKAGAGQVYSVEAYNNSTTVNYLRLYNATTGFNGCNSATNLVGQWIIPASATGAGVAKSYDMGIAFATGISICVTSGYAQTDTTNATASALIVNIGYK